jgi:uncharacterized protein YndB with AHSA1/START domain
MKLAAIILAVLVGTFIITIAAAALIGSLLDAHHTSTRSALVRRPRSDVYRMVIEPARYPEWRPDVRSIDILPAVDSRVRFLEHGASDTVTYEISEAVPDERVITTILDEDLGYRGTWTYTFTSQGDQTLVTITEDGEVTNVVFRFMARFIFGYTGGLDAYLKALKARS